MSRADSQFKLRMPSCLRAQVEVAACEANRSLNAEIVTRLQSSFEAAPVSLDGVVPIPESLLERMARIRELADVTRQGNHPEGITE